MNQEEIKFKVKEYIEKGLLEEAEQIIEQYKKIIGYDDEISSMDSIINIYRENYDEALRNIQVGLQYNIFNSDLYFTMGNIHELRREYNRAYLCYEHALVYSNDKVNSKLILETMDDLKNNCNVEVNNYSIVILTYNQLEYTKVCIDSIKKYNGGENCEIIIVDNNSTDGTVEWIKQQEGIKYILNEENKGFPAGCNQGIKIAKEDNDIFLLNNDTVIMPNSIFNLRMGLYYDEQIGATGAISNSASYCQQISEEYNDFNEYMNSALKNNIPNEERYEKRLKLVGFAMLIKRKVLNEVGLLDERFTPGNFEDDDLSFRILMKGYKLLLCKDSYIHHFGSVSFNVDMNKYSELLERNSLKFKEKWGFKSEEAVEIRVNALINIDKNLSNKEEKINILEIGCGLGATLVKIKEMFPNSNVYGVENNKEILTVAKKMNIGTEVQDGTNINFKELIFDIIIISKEDMYDCINKLDNNISKSTKIIRENGIENQNNIEFTGERLVINDFVRNRYSDVMEEHLSRYRLASEYVKDKTVIDAACGTGYGTVILSKAGAVDVKGVDISKEAVESAKYNYNNYKNIEFKVGDVTKLDVSNSSVEVFVSFETIEHINCGHDLIMEASRILKDDGIFIVSTPNRNATNPGLLFDEKPLNIYHSFEYSPLEFIGDLSSEFDIVELYGQTVNENIEFTKNKYIRELFGKQEINYSSINSIKDYECRKITEFKNFEPMYLVAVCKKKNNRLLNQNNLKNENMNYENKIEENIITINSTLARHFSEFGQNSIIHKDYKINKFQGISIGKNTFIKDNCWLNVCIDDNRKEPRIVIGDECQIGSRFSISSSNMCIIQRNVIVGPNVYIADCEHNYQSIGIPVMYQGITSVSNKVIIGANSWIGINATIVGNVTVGRGCVIGANSYVTKDVPDYSVVGGSPAKIIKMYDTISQEWIRVRNDDEVEKLLKNRREQPLISICIPTFNRANELEKCLSSIYSQIGNDSLFEVFISNNDSQDNTEEVINKYERLYNNITYNKNKINIGGDKNIAVTIEKSKGKYMILHGDDDYFKPNTIYQLMNIINNNPKNSLYFINMLSNENKVKLCYGINEFLECASIGAGFISSIIIARTEYEKIEEPFKFIDTCFNQIYLQFSILLNNPNFVLINSPFFDYEGNDPNGYNFGKVFIKSYLDILDYFKNYGLKEENIKKDKLKILESTIIPWYKGIVSRKMDIDINDFEKYFIDYYKSETYFQEVYKMIKDIKELDGK